MRAIVISRPGGPEVLDLRDVPSPEPGPSDVRVRVRATAVNRADLLQRLGKYPAPKGSPADIPGLEFAGEVDAVGRDVDELRVGDRVFGLVGGGAYAEHIVVHSRALVRMPEGMAFVEAAAIPEAFVTVYDAIVLQAGIAAGETLLVHAVGSGLGTAAVQLTKTLGVRSIGTSRSERKLEPARALGLDEGIVVEKGEFAGAVLERTGGAGVSAVLELVGGSYVGEDLRCITSGGRIVVVGTMGGSSTELDLGLLLRKRARVMGTVLRSRPLEEKIQAAQVLGRNLVPLFERGSLKPVVDRVLRLEEARTAHEYVAGNDSFGKVVLTV